MRRQRIGSRESPWRRGELGNGGWITEAQAGDGEATAARRARETRAAWRRGRGTGAGRGDELAGTGRGGCMRRRRVEPLGTAATGEEERGDRRLWRGGGSAGAKWIEADGAREVARESDEEVGQGSLGQGVCWALAPMGLLSHQKKMSCTKNKIAV
ncbi:hypothetical protein ZWY2020_004214 [Hordeum vulgare]|nr:hypothetical protein ZWY2020_004214 [Hordeum vulgare]